jgi:glycosyltransferase involved in cell wall biosynthesis
VFAIAGPTIDQTYLEQLENDVERSPFSARIRFLGYRKDPEFLLKAADLLIHSAREEPFGLVIAESLCAGTPVVAFDVGGVREILSDGRSGFLALPFDASDLAQKAIRILEDDRLAETMREYGSGDIRSRFAVESFAEKVRRVITEAGTRG